VSAEAKLDINEDVYVDQFKPFLMDVVHAWCKGATFLQLCKMTSIFEGKGNALFFPTNFVEQHLFFISFWRSSEGGCKVKVKLSLCFLFFN